MPRSALPVAVDGDNGVRVFADEDNGTFKTAVSLSQFRRNVPASQKNVDDARLSRALAILQHKVDVLPVQIPLGHAQPHMRR